MHKPITQIREDKNGNITFKFMPKGQLAALNESSVFVDNLTTNGFTLSWNKVENAEAYHLSLSYLNDTEEITFLEIDSLKQPTYSIDNLPEATEIKCHIVALADKYEDAPEYTHIVTIPADQITDTTGTYDVEWKFDYAGKAAMVKDIDDDGNVTRWVAVIMTCTTTASKTLAD